MANIKQKNMLWEEIDESAFQDEQIEEANISEYNMDKQIIFIANINYSRQMPKLMDGLKTVERRILYTMFNMKLTPNTKDKCLKIVGETSKMHVHGDMALYKALVGMAQYWKRAVPLIKGTGNFGNASKSEGYADKRYTEASMSKYAKECFFEDFDIDCVDMIQSSLVAEEPIQLPSKFPNILINGGVGIAVGNKLGIPPYHVNDVYTICKRLMEDPDASNIYIYPEIPTGCDIVSDNRSLKDICDNGEGVLRMRARIDIEENHNNYVLRVRNLPWLVDLEKVNDKILALVKDNKLPIKEIQNASSGYKEDGEIKVDIDYRIFISKAQDPYVIRDMLFKNTDLASSLSVQFKIVTEDLYIGRKNMKDLVLSWLDERREYKRRLYNKKIIKNRARISLLNILIELLSEKNIEKTVGIIRKNTRDNAAKALVSDYGMNSYQAQKIVELPLISFTSDAKERYIAERDKLVKDTDKILEVVHSKKKIDDIILCELEDMKKYGKPKKCRLITTKNDQVISDSNHTIIITKKGYLKKLPADDSHLNKDSGKMRSGVFSNGDYPIHRIECGNLDSIMLFDSNGKYSIVPLATIPNTDFNSVGNKIYDVAKLDGEIVYAAQYVDNTFKEFLEDNELHPNLISLTKNGYIKRTPLNELKLESSVKGGRYSKVRANDQVVFSFIMFDNTNILIYTQKGNYSYIKVDDVTPMSKEGTGVSCITMEPDDCCVGCCAIGSKTEYIVLLTEKGNMKKISIDSLSLNRRKQTSYISSLPKNDKILFCDSAKEDSQIMVCNKLTYTKLGMKDIPLLPRRANPQKVVSVNVGDNIINMIVSY